MTRDRDAVRAVRILLLVAFLAPLPGCPWRRSLDVNRDGVVDALDVAAVAACLGEDVGAVPGCRAADIDIDGRVEQDDLDFLLAEAAPVDFPSLVASEPVAGAVQVPRTAWIRLDFSETWKKRAPGSLTLECDDEAQAFRVARLSAKRLVVNPDADLPPGAQCRLAWTGPGGAAESLAFDIAASGSPASVLYDRRDASLLPPFPDDYWLTPDATTATGQRVAIGVPERDGDVVQLFGALTTDTGVLDGFSPLALIAVELSDAPDPASLPMTVAQSLDPLASVGLFDLTASSPEYGKRVPFQLHVRSDALGDRPVDHSLVAFPSIPLTPGGRYAFVVTRRALVDAARPFDASPFLQAALAPAVDGEAPSIAAVREIVAPALDALERFAPPLHRDDLALVLRISVRSTSTLSDDLLAMKQQVLADSPPTLTIASTQAASGGGAVVRGTFQAPDWRQGHFLARDANGAPRITRRKAVPFVLALPAAAESAAVPVVMYQHGNPGTAEDAYTDPCHLRRDGFAVAGFTDTLNREFASVGQQMFGIFGVLLFSGHVPALWIQTYGEQFAFLRALETLATRDFLPIAAKDGVPELDLARPLSYLGVSYGANHGQAFLPYAPEIHAAALVAGGSRLAELLFHQNETDPLEVGGILDLVAAQVPNVRAPEVWVGLSIFQMLFDAQDPQNQLSRLYRDPIEVAGTTRKASVLAVEGIRDGFIPSNASRSLAWIAGPLPHLAPVEEAVPTLESVTGFVRANIDADTTGAFVQYACTYAWGDGHYCAQEDSRLQQLAFFLSAQEGGPPTIAATDLDSDGDGLSDLREAQLRTDPLLADSDGDGLDDGVEVREALDPLDPTDAAADRDGDGLSNEAEIALGTLVNGVDSDGDRVRDGDEVALGTNPLLRDTDGGGRTDWEESNGDATNPLDRFDDIPLMTLPGTVVDGAGFEWEVLVSGAINGKSRPFSYSDGGFRLSVGEQSPWSYLAPTEDGGRQITIGGTTGALRVTRRIYAPIDAGFLRLVDIAENPGEEPASVEVRVSSGLDSSYRILTTSDGDPLIGAFDHYAVIGRGVGAAAPSLAHGFSGPGAAVQPTATLSTSGFSLRYPVVIPARGRVAVMSFALQDWSEADAVARIESLLALEGDALFGLTSSERKAIVNFAAAPDADADGLLDDDEVAVGTDPANPDSDGDGLLDGFEFDHGFDPLQAGDDVLDPDADGVGNWLEQLLGTDPRDPDSDGDDLNDGDEVAAGTDPLRVDTDRDGLDDGREVSLGTDPLDANGDADGDGLTDADEVLRYLTDPLLLDSDGDGLRDDFEVANYLDPNDPADALSDGDEDGLSVAEEVAIGTSFWDPDSDDDLLLDGDEVARGTDPLAADTDGGGRSDWQEVTIDGTDPLDADDELSLVALPVEFVDGAGFGWTVDERADLTGGLQPAIAWESGFWLTGSIPYDAVMRDGGREVIALISPFYARRKIFVPADGAFVRVLEVIEDQWGFSFSYNGFYRYARLGSGTATTVVATSSGDLVADTGDGFVVTDDEDGSGAPAVVQIFAGAGAAAQPLFVAWWDVDLLHQYFEVSLPAYSRKILLTFLALADSRAEAIALANHLATLPPEALEGMDAAERADVVNFVVPPAAP